MLGEVRWFGCGCRERMLGERSVLDADQQMTTLRARSREIHHIGLVTHVLSLCVYAPG